MPRTSRASQGGYVYHVLNRGNGRADVFHKDDDFAAFLWLMREAHEKIPMRLVGYCCNRPRPEEAGQALFPVSFHRERNSTADALLTLAGRESCHVGERIVAISDHGAHR